MRYVMNQLKDYMQKNMRKEKKMQRNLRQIPVIQQHGGIYVKQLRFIQNQPGNKHGMFVSYFSLFFHLCKFLYFLRFLI